MIIVDDHNRVTISLEHNFIYYLLFNTFNNAS